MPNPKAPRSRRQLCETVTDLDHAVGRLRKLGATGDELGQVRDNWFDNSDGEMATSHRYLRDAPDGELLRALKAVRSEHDKHTTTETEAIARSDAYTRERARAEAYDVIGRNVHDVLAWVGDDPVRAEVVIALEQNSDGAHRKTLLDPLAALLDAG